MSKAGTGTAKPRLDHSIFEAELYGSSLNTQMLWRLLGWCRPYLRLAVVSLLLVVLASILAVLLPVVITRVVIDGILMEATAGGMPDFGMTEVHERLQGFTGLPELASACLLYGLMTILCHCLYHLHRITFARAILSSLRDLRQDLFDHMELRPASFYDKVAVGRIMTRVTNDVQALFEMLMGLGLLVGEFVPFLVALAVMLALDVELTAYLLLSIPVFAVVTHVFRRATRHVYRLIRSSVSRMNQNLQENLSGMQVVQLSNRENRNLDAYSRINRGNRRQEMRAVALESSYGAFMDNMVNLGLAAIIWFGGGSVIQGAISLGAVILFTQFIDMLIRPIRALGNQYNILFRAMASCERIFQALDWEEQLHEPANPGKLPTRIRGEIEFRDLTFGYSPDEPVLEQVSFTIGAGEKLAVVGPTGSGKSTLVRLLGRFYDLPDGSIFLDGVDLNRLRTADLRRRLGVVPQDFHIFSGSVLNNIRLGNPEISAEQAVRAAQLVNADDFIQALPNGYDTPLVERGQNLSQGERQLLAFARVMATDPELLILDEATASIDTETEQLIQTALKRVTRGRTCILVAHRLQTIQEADRILVLKDGRVKELGTHDELMAMKGVYYTLNRLQFQQLV